MAKSEKNKGSLAGNAPGKYSLARVKEFSGEVKNEFNKIAWPDKKHTIGSTGVVVVLVMIISFYLGAVDLILGKIIGAILK
jgi:preprotein translocase subunit SecE